MTTSTITVTLSTDTEADSGYIVTERRGPERRVAHTVPIRADDGQVYGALDLAADGALVGIELLGISRLLPDRDP